MRALARFLLVAFLAAVLMAASVAMIAPQARSIVTAGTAKEVDVASQLTPLSQRSVVLAADGSFLGYLHAEENRQPVTLEQVPEPLVTSILAIEDQEFWNHVGLNLRATARALLTNVEAGDVRQGGSTITQQLIKNALLTPEQDIDRKLNEAVLALRLEEQMSKEDILERYLNTVYFGNGAYGVQAASEIYFGMPVEQVGWEQAAFLAGLIRNPVGYDPFKFPEKALARRDVVVRTLADLGELSADESAWLQAVPIPAQPFTPIEPPRDYFLEEVKKVLLADERLGETPTERYNAVFKGGLTVKTTLDPRLQMLAREAVATAMPKTGLDHVDPRTGEPGRFTAALVSVEPATGAVRAIHSGEDFQQSQYRLATQGLRQPGSSFKPIVLAAALENGYSPNDTINGASPCTLRPKDSPLLVEDWDVENYEGSRGGTGTLAAATAKSLNCAYARLVLLLGPDKVVELAAKLGITSNPEPVPSITLGAEEVHPIDMASAFGTFANDGLHHDPYFVEEVSGPDGKVIIKHDDPGEQAISNQTARQMNQVLQGVVTGGTGTRARLPGRQVAGKTGTAQNWEDAWFVGYTPQLSTAVWMGSPLGKVSMRNVGGTRVTGGSFPAAIWKAFMAPALGDAPAIAFEKPGPSPKGKYLRLGTERSSSRSSSPSRRRTSSTTTPTTAAGGSSTTAPGGGASTTAPPATSPPTTSSPTTSPPPTTPPPTAPPATPPPPSGGGGESSPDG